MAAAATADAPNTTVTLTSETQEPGPGAGVRATEGQREEPGERERSHCQKGVQLQSYSHTVEKVFCCSQPHCAKAFVSKYKLLRHMATHSPQKNHQCSFCEKMFHRKDHLKNHLQTHDPNKESFRCEECGKRYHTKLGYRRHAAMHSATSGDLTCKVCLQGCESTAALLEHLRAHSGKPAATGGLRERRHPCTHCDRRFYTRKDVRRHLVVHTGRKDFLCPHCAQRFGRKDHLTRHAKKSHPQEPLGAKVEPLELTTPAGMIKEELGQLVCGGTPRGKSFASSFPVSLYDPALQPPLASQPCLSGVGCHVDTPCGPPDPSVPLSLPLPLSHHAQPHSHPLQQQHQQHPPMVAPVPPKNHTGSTSYLKMEMDSFLMDLQSGLPVPTLVETLVPPPAQAPPHAPLSEDVEALCGDTVLPKGLAEPFCAANMDFSHLLSFLPLSLPPYSAPMSSGGLLMGYTSSASSTVASLSSSTSLSSHVAEPLMSPLSTVSDPTQESVPPLALGFSPALSATTLPRFHQAFQ
ncbi:zinc finger protein PLAGL2-like [Arapaima gigas]